MSIKNYCIAKPKNQSDVEIRNAYLEKILKDTIGKDVSKITDFKDGSVKIAMDYDHYQDILMQINYLNRELLSYKIKDKREYEQFLKDQARASLTEEEISNRLTQYHKQDKDGLKEYEKFKAIMENMNLSKKRKD